MRTKTLLRQILMLVALVTLCTQLVHGVQLPAQPREVARTSDAALGQREAGLGIAPGTKVGDFKAGNHDGKRFSLAGQLKKGPVLLVFYRGGWCPYCNYQIRELARAWPSFESRGVTPVLVSVDAPDAASLVKKSYEIPFPVVSDPDLVAHKAFNVLLELDAGTIERYKGFGIDLAQWSGRDHGTIAVSSAFIIDTDGTVKWAHVDTDFKTRPSNSQLLQAVDKSLK